jgi:hypothetical protein
VEFILVLVAAALAPIGWPADRVLKAWITGLIPETHDCRAGGCRVFDNREYLCMDKDDYPCDEPSIAR